MKSSRIVTHVGTALILVTLSAVAVSAQSVNDESRGSRVRLTGVTSYDLAWSILRTSQSDTMVQFQRQGDKKNPYYAAAMSLAIPGLGQAYTQEWWRTALYAAVEIGLWTAYVSYNSAGDRKDEEFRTYADEHFSVVQYVRWIGRNSSSLNNADTSGVILWAQPGHPWEMVDWSRLNSLERSVASGSSVTGFTHTLPERPQQQYYELIGKYMQYISGWDDNPDPTLNDVLQGRTSPRFEEYRKMRGDANDLYAKAALAGSVILVNHILSAIDAAWSASSYNRHVHVEAAIVPIFPATDTADLMAVATVKYSFR